MGTRISLRGILITIVIFILISIGVSACDHYCSSCDNCEAKITAAVDETTICLSQDISTTETCINNPADFDNKIFDCQGHTIDGEDNKGTFGIYLNGKSGNTIKNCVITDFSYGMYLFSSSSNSIISNTISSNLDYGIYLYSSSNFNSIISNTISSNARGIYLRGSSNNNIIDNTVDSSSDDGIFLLNSDSNTITDNAANSNNRDGIVLSISGDNNILNSNTVYSNGQYDINIHDADSNSGSGNTCDTTNNWGDAGTTGCTHAYTGAENVPPTADAGTDKVILAGYPVNFDGSDSDDSDGTITSYEWDFGDGESETGIEDSTEYTYSKIGEYTVTLTVTDDDDAEGTDTITVTTIDSLSSGVCSEAKLNCIGDLTNKFNAVKKKIYDGKCKAMCESAALNKLNNDIIPHINEWVADGEVKEQLLALAQGMIEDIYEQCGC